MFSRISGSTVLICLISVLGMLVSLSSLPPAWAEITQPLPSPVPVENVLTQANQIKLLVGLLLFMIGGWIWWFKRYITSNDKKHDAHFARAEKLAEAGQQTALALKELVVEYNVRKDMSKE